MRNKSNILLIVVVFIILTLNIVGMYIQNMEKPKYVSYKDFYTELESGNISAATIEDNSVQFSKNNDDTKYYTENPKYDNFKENLLLNGVKVETNSTQETIAFVFDIIFYLMFFGIIIFGISKLISFNQKTFKVVRQTKVKFENIAGMDELKAVQQ